AKGLANGSPVGGTIATPEIGDAIRTMTISTFGGNPVTMAAAGATLDVVVGERLPERVSEMGDLFFDGLDRLRDRHRFIGDVRGKGLMIGLELVGEAKTPAPELTVRLLELAREEGLLVGRGGLYGNVIRLTPPMTITPDEVEEALQKLGRAADRLEGAAV
ncbi:MAG: aminotransferase class III-fold pyridoxal phosphate-dependent enzyme, partial [Bacillota bacterium]